MSAGATCTLRIVRHSGYADFLRSYKIFVNGAEAGTIARNSVLDLTVPSGPVAIEARIDWGRSRPLTIDAAPGQRIEVEVYNTWGAFLAIWGVTLGYRSYLTVRQLPAS